VEDRRRADDHLSIVAGMTRTATERLVAALRAAYGEAWVSVLPSVGEAFGLEVDESMLTGESVPVAKHPGTGDGAAPRSMPRT